MRKPKKTVREEKLEAELAKSERALLAVTEWFYCHTKGHAVNTLDVNVEGGLPSLRLHVHGMGRSAGGVVVVEVLGDGYHDMPRLLDDLCSEWLCDASPQIRQAARVLLQRREDFNAAQKAG